MPAATVGGPGGPPPDRKADKPQVPFLVGSNQYAEKIFSEPHDVTAGESKEYVHNVTPGGFLRGITLFVRSTGGVLGSGTLAQDNPWSLLSSISLENIDGSPIKHPLSGYAYYLENKYGKPWFGDPKNYAPYSESINPCMVLRIFPEVRDTAGALANTDARSQYRLRYTIGAGNPNIATGQVTTWPRVTVTGFLETWSQTDQQDLHGNPIAPLPPGLALGSLLRHDVKTLNPSGANTLIQLANTGNEFRAIMLVIRDNKGERVDALADPIRFRLDDRSMWVRSPDSLLWHMTQHYPALNLGTSERETGVYVIPRFRHPGQRQGEHFLPTSNASYVLLETSTQAGAKNMPGTVEVITDEVVPVGPVPPDMEGI